MGESPLLHVDGSHQSALSDNVCSTLDSPISAFAYRIYISIFTSDMQAFFHELRDS